MNRKLVYAALLAAIALPIAARAAPPAAESSAPDHAFAREFSAHELTDEDRAAFTDARIAALKAGLKLTAAQEKNWPALESALRDLAKTRAERIAEWRDYRADAAARDALDMLRRRAAMLSARSAEFGKLADAAKPLYDTLDEAQKNRFGMLLRSALGQGHWGHARMGRGR